MCQTKTLSDEEFAEIVKVRPSTMEEWLANGNTCD